MRGISRTSVLHNSVQGSYVYVNVVFLQLCTTNRDPYQPLSVTGRHNRHICSRLLSTEGT